jgi:saccharopine dehydrogenase (NAD+, L-lysine-forming)
MRITVLGAGAMGAAAARLLGRREGLDLLVLDADPERAQRTVDDLGTGEARGAAEAGALADAIRETDAVAACIPYRFNLQAMEAALAAGRPYVDLGGLYHMTLSQLELDERFREAGIPAVIGVGCCPGLSNVLARLGADRLDAAERIDIVDGAIDEGAGFGVPYSADTILDEFTMPAKVFLGGELREVPPGSGAIRFRFVEPLGEMEAVYTLHSELATLPYTIPGVRDVQWRLALPPGVGEGFKVLVDLGLAQEEPVETSSGSVVPRELLRTLLDRLPPPEGPPKDVEILWVRVQGSRGGRPATFTAKADFRPQPDGVSAGAFGTALPLTVAARWLAEGRVAPGVHPPENALDPEPFVEELSAEGVSLRLSLEESLPG